MRILVRGGLLALAIVVSLFGLRLDTANDASAQAAALPVASTGYVSALVTAPIEWSKNKNLKWDDFKCVRCGMRKRKRRAKG